MLFSFVWVSAALSNLTGKNIEDSYDTWFYNFMWYIMIILHWFIDPQPNEDYSSISHYQCTRHNALSVYRIDLIHKSQNAPVPYPTMLNSEQKCAHFCSEWSIVGYGTGAFWDLLNWSIAFPELGNFSQQAPHFPANSFLSNMLETPSKQVFPAMKIANSWQSSCYQQFVQVANVAWTPPTASNPEHKNTTIKEFIETSD